MPVLPSLPIAGTRVASERVWQRNIPLPIRKQYGVEVIMFYKTSISKTSVCPTTLKYIKTATSQTFWIKFWDISISFKLQSSSLDHCDVANVNGKRPMSTSSSLWQVSKALLNWVDLNIFLLWNVEEVNIIIRTIRIKVWHITRSNTW